MGQIQRSNRLPRARCHQIRRVLGGGAAAPAVVGWEWAYHERVVDHYENPRNVGSFENDKPSVGTGLVGAPGCGDVMKLQIRVDESSSKIIDACFETFGCGSAIASSSVGEPQLFPLQITPPWMERLPPSMATGFVLTRPSM
ncbi:hypothetical protein E2562_031434 [Oryza meyeriana var. granulata]|uniref:NIF system FeS cluster assembly NifU N-terminal domain-containing protein n=1 Tax=Oryza meyeriana var. granulata TaxID=110450 RepID=A0A6G1C1L1_9ORYZ|nr:hypothetical protein E2562_031434 [Oryza meyeriana var. granulata]KAF0893900.1 hypothetical protein E2562_031434 [Oryza meyeriana var. granulata]KAF0893901.1 hypothetical protein E2562_031434 [Oryza meyeriana var. granulata]